MKKNYETPAIELVKLDPVDVITTSLPIFTEDNVIPDGWVEA